MIYSSLNYIKDIMYRHIRSPDLEYLTLTSHKILVEVPLRAHTQNTQFSLHLEHVVQFTLRTRSSDYTKKTQFSLHLKHVVQFTPRTHSSVNRQYTKDSFTSRTRCSVYTQSTQFRLHQQYAFQFTSKARLHLENIVKFTHSIRRSVYTSTRSSVYTSYKQVSLQPEHRISS